MLKCHICGAENSVMISPSHLKKHGLTAAQYREQFPGAILRIQSPESRAKVSATRKGQPAHNKGKPISKEQREKQKQTMLVGYSTGRLVHHNLGKKTSSSTKKKIADSVRAQAAPLVAMREEVRQATKLAKIQERESAAVQKQEELHTFLSQRHLRLVDGDETHITLECTTCQTRMTRTSQYLDMCRRDLLKCTTCHPTPRISIAEQEIATTLRDWGLEVQQGNRTILLGREIDILVPSHNIGIEFNGLYWHAETNRPHPKHMLWKTKLAASQGIRIIHIFEDEYRDKKDIVLSRLASIFNLGATKINARSCIIRNLTPKESNTFLLANHLQGAGSASIRLGLEHKGELVMVATFAKTSISKGGTGDSWELVRLCSTLNRTVRGGAQRLITAFRRDNPGVLISYADRRWSNGDLYRKLGFSFDGESPASYWYLRNYAERVHRATYMKHRLVVTEEDRDLTEWQLARRAGLDRIWDCGTTKWKLEPLALNTP